MILDLKPLLRGETDCLEFDYYLTPDAIPDVTFSSDAHVTGKITDNAGYMRLSLSVSVEYNTECARCLSPVSGSFDLTFERTVTTEENNKENEEDGVYDDEYVVISDGAIDVDEEIREELLLSFPQRLLCREDCEGLCPKCGKPKSLGDCGCETKEIDPRLAVLRQLLRKDGQDDK